MSERHPIISITGSSGAGTSSVTRTFQQIFRREGVAACTVEGTTSTVVPSAAQLTCVCES
ncbi:MAG: hypothetical protein ACK54X_08525 [Burkholderiales bacterium]|jgi:phosphoribulokinase